AASAGRGGASGSAGPARDLVRPELTGHRGGLRAVAILALPVAGTSVAVAERRGTHPGCERIFVAPPGDDQPGGPAVGWLEQLETLEAVLVVHRAGPGGEPVGELVPAVGVNGDRVDLDHAHECDDATRAQLVTRWLDRSCEDDPRADLGFRRR